MQQRLSYDLHVTEILKQCRQRIYLLRLLRNQGLPIDQMNTVFTGLIVSSLLCALPAWEVLVSAGQAGVDAFLKRAHKWGFCKDVTFNELLIKSGSSLFQKMQSPVHCLNSLLPPKKKTDYKHRKRHCSYTLLQCNFNVFKHLFVSWCLFYVSLSLHCIILIVFMHVCCVIFYKVSVSVIHRVTTVRY